LFHWVTHFQSKIEITTANANSGEKGYVKSKANELSPCFASNKIFSSGFDYKVKIKFLTEPILALRLKFKV
jgi:hypothetical protein